MISSKWCLASMGEGKLSWGLLQELDWWLKIAFSRLLKPNSAPTIRFIQWHHPSYGWRKVNIVDGSSLGSSGKAGCGRSGDIFRYFLGHWHLGFSSFICSATNMAAELWAICHGINVSIETKTFSFWSWVRFLRSNLLFVIFSRQIASSLEEFSIISHPLAPKGSFMPFTRVISVLTSWLVLVPHKLVL